MLVKVFWINQSDSGRIGIIPRPRGGDWLEDEIASLHNSHADVIVSLLEYDEILELELEQEQTLCEETGITFIHFPIADRGVPTSCIETTTFLRDVERFLSEGKNIVIHCRQGVGRSAMIAALFLVTNGAKVEDAFEQISIARGCEVPDTVKQKDWVISFAESI